MSRKVIMSSVPQSYALTIKADYQGEIRQLC